MLATFHALSGGIILKTIPDPRIALPLAFLSHFILDSVPHWDFTTSLSKEDSPQKPLTLAGRKDRKKIFVLAAFDVILGFGLTFWLFQNLNPYWLFGSMIFAQLPDWLEIPYFFGGYKIAPSIWVKRFQHRVHSRLYLPWGLITQIAIFVPLLWWILA
ncbi:hypothetical protein HY439_01420 [Candidatus Microgenomates bacterium]|nr:hypothetical protein [Candidatus Microgenomates bacterium]